MQMSGDLATRQEVMDNDFTDHVAQDNYWNDYRHDFYVDCWEDMADSCSR